MAISTFGDRSASMCKAWFCCRSAMLRSKFERAEMPWILLNAPRSVRWSGKIHDLFDDVIVAVELKATRTLVSFVS